MGVQTVGRLFDVAARASMAPALFDSLQAVTAV